MSSCLCELHKYVADQLSRGKSKFKSGCIFQDTVQL